jgi:hypothetical protein
VIAAADLSHPDVGPHIDTLGAVQASHQRTDLLAKHRGQRRRLRLDQDDVDTQAAQTGRHLTTAESRADHHGAVRRGGVPAQGEAFVKRPQHPDPLQVRECRNAPRHQACRDDEFVISQR